MPKSIESDPRHEKEGRSFMGLETGKRIGEVKIKTYIVKNDSGLLRLEKATIRTCTISENEAMNRACTELGNTEGGKCEELVLVYRPSGCVREKIEVDLDEVTTVSAASDGTKEQNE
jgi:hypothetical protein